MTDKRQYEFFLLRYVPDAVKSEFVNIGVVLLGMESDYAEVRLTRDWRRVRCLDPAADIELLEGLERDLRKQLSEGTDREVMIRRLQESFSNLVQVREKKEDATSILTAVVETDVDRNEEAVAFAVAMLEKSAISIASVAEMPHYAEVARSELSGTRL